MSPADTAEDRGTGITYAPVVATLIEQCARRYRAQCDTFVARKAMSKKQAGDMEAGFIDGMRTMLQHLEGLGAIKVAK